MKKDELNHGEQEQHHNEILTAIILDYYGSSHGGGGLPWQHYQAGLGSLSAASASDASV